jgi:hypothetical protein
MWLTQVLHDTQIILDRCCATSQHSTADGAVSGQIWHKNGTGTLIAQYDYFQQTNFKIKIPWENETLWAITEDPFALFPYPGPYGECVP